MKQVATCTCGAPMYDFGIDICCANGFKCPDLDAVFTRVRPDWDEYGLALAKTVSLRADCRRAQHGAVILGTDHRVVGTGYNGYPAGVPGCLEGACPRGLVLPSQLPHRAPYDAGVGRCDAVHAEANALLHADRREVRGGTMYHTGAPCHGCRVLMAGSGLARALWPDGELNWGVVL